MGFLARRVERLRMGKENTLLSTPSERLKDSTVSLRIPNFRQWLVERDILPPGFWERSQLTYSV